MNTREKFLNSIREINKSYPVSSNESWKEELVNVLRMNNSLNNDLLIPFLASVEKTGGQAFQFQSLDQLKDWIRDYCIQNNVRKLIVSLNKLAVDFCDSFLEWSSHENLQIKIQSTQELNSDQSIQLREYIADAELAITYAWAGFADSGTVVISSGAGESRSASLLPPTHICILQRDAIYENMESALPTIKSIIQNNSPSAITFIGGPSRTADIEKVLVTGVHGPKNFIVCIIP